MKRHSTYIIIATAAAFLSLAATAQGKDLLSIGFENSAEGNSQKYTSNGTEIFKTLNQGQAKATVASGGFESGKSLLIQDSATAGGWKPQVLFSLNPAATSGTVTISFDYKVESLQAGQPLKLGFEFRGSSGNKFCKMRWKRDQIYVLDAEASAHYGTTFDDDQWHKIVISVSAPSSASKSLIIKVDGKASEALTYQANGATDLKQIVFTSLGNIDKKIRIDNLVVSN